MVFHGSRLDFHGSRWVLHGVSWFQDGFHGPRLVFMVSDRFSWFFMVPGVFFSFFTLRTPYNCTLAR